MYSMKEACTLTNMTYENLKFYCNEGLVPNVKRDRRNYRVFDEHDIKWIQSLNCLKSCGMSIAAYDPFMTKEQVEGYGAKYYEDYVELLKDSDVVSIHVPLTDQTRNMISKKELSVMKPTALIINCSRGGIINEADLVEALNNGVIAGAGTDVFCSEPPKTDDPLLNCRNLIVSPHSAAQTREAVIKMAQMCVKGCLAVAEGKKWPYVADKSVYEHEKWKGADWAEV